LQRPITAGERQYNRRHIKTRNIVERTIGILKNRFGCLSNKLRYEPQLVGNIIVASCDLHNLAIRMTQILPHPLHPDYNVVMNEGVGNAFRQTLIDNFFTDFERINLFLVLISGF
jgi:hypothetical protein